jgi:hypothetical protein
MHYTTQVVLRELPQDERRTMSTEKKDAPKKKWASGDDEGTPGVGRVRLYMSSSSLVYTIAGHKEQRRSKEECPCPNLN